MICMNSIIVVIELKLMILMMVTFRWDCKVGQEVIFDSEIDNHLNDYQLVRDRYKRISSRKSVKFVEVDWIKYALASRSML